MSRFRPLAVAFCLAAVSAVLVAAPSSGADGSSDRATARPQVGQCRNMTATAMGRASNNSPTVPCSSTHTTLTFAVPRLPSGVTYRGMTSAKMSEWGIKLCTPPFWNKVNPTHTIRDRSLYGFAFFVPTAAERSAGARWVRCDLMWFSDNVLQPLLPGTSARPVVPGPVPDQVKRCLKRASGTLIDIACDQTHHLRPYAAFFFKHRAFPTRSEFIAAGKRRCPGAVYWTWPGKTWWAMGDHAVVCYRNAA